MSPLPSPDPDKTHQEAEYKTLEDILQDVTVAFTTDNAATTADYINQVIPYHILTHAAQHHIRSTAPLYVNPVLVQATYLAMARLFMDGFLAGAKLQSQRDAELLNGVDFPDDLGGLDAA